MQPEELTACWSAIRQFPESILFQIFYLFQSLWSVYVGQFFRSGFQKNQVLFVPPDDRVPAMIFPEFQEFREEAGREETGIAPDAVMGKSGDFIRLTAPEFHQCRYGFPPEKRLVAD